jgi:hypothetical protein
MSEVMNSNTMVWLSTYSLDSSDVDYILKECSELELREAEVGNDESDLSGVERDVRRCMVGDIYDLEIVEMCNRLFSDANEIMGINFDRCKEVQYLEYTGDSDVNDVAGFYTWHQDIEETKFYMYERKISLSIQLSDSKDYDGCELKFSHIDVNPEQREKGSVIAFPSYFTHEVTPCTRGLRKCIVAWAHGPLWR